MRALRALAGLLILVSVESATAQAPPRSFLFKDARSELAAARARGETDIVILIASAPGENARVARQIGQLGGTIQYRDDDVDYLRARVPVDRVDEIASDRRVYSVAISPRPRTPTGGGGGGNTDAIAATDTTKKRVWPPPLLSWEPIRNRYDPTGDMRGLEFRRQNPTFDGRGVTLAMIDMSADPLLPELQSALTLDGKPVRKIAGYLNTLDPDEEDDGRWLRMKDEVTATGGQFTYGDRTYTAPRDGRFRIEVLDEAKFDSLARVGLNGDLNRDGNPEGSSRLFAVLWDERTDDVWVDTNQNANFTDDKALTDYSVRQEFGVFGTDDPVTAVRESVGFGVQIDKAKKRVALNIGTASHASLVVGAALASRGERGRFDGVAPGAQLVNVAEGCAPYGQTEAVIVALKDPKVDVAWLEHCSNITRPYTLRDGRMTTTIIYERLIAKTKKPIMIPTHNYPVLGGTDDIVLAAGAIGIGGHESKENFFRNHGVRVQHDDNLLITGGYGPMGHGGFGPDVIAPSNYISTALGWQETRPIAGLYRLPPGYTIAGGTSTATPTATGAVALLISAAKQTGIKYDAFRLRHAIISSARYVPHIPAYKQGSGVLNIEGAWEILKALNDAPEPVNIIARAPVRHEYSHMLPTPHEGVGLYERSGWTAGQRGERTVTFTRTTGPRGAMEFKLVWIGNDHGTFSAPSTVSLPLNQPVEVKIGIAPKSAGAQTAILTLQHDQIPGFSHRMLATIVAAHALHAQNSFTVEDSVEVPRPEMRSFFYDVPAGTKALRVDVQTRTRDVAVALVQPDTRTATARRAGAAGGGGGGGGFGGGGGARRATYIVSDPMPGVWEVRLSDLADVSSFDAMQAEKDEPAPPTKGTLTVAAIAVDAVAPSIAASNGSGATDEVRLANRMAEFEGAVSALPYGALRADRPTIRAGEQLRYEIDVPTGTERLVVRASDFADTAADVDVYVFDCTGRECRNAQTDSDPHGDEVVAIDNPSAGKWTVLVDGAYIPGGSTTFTYADVIFNPAYGTVTTADFPQKRKAGEEWTTRAHTWLAGTLPEGRQPYPAVRLMGKQGGTTFELGVLELAPPASAASTQQQR